MSSLSSDAAVAQTLQAAWQAYACGDLATAKQHAQRLLRMAPASAAGLHLAGRVEYQLQNYRAAADLLARAVKLNPASAACLIDLGTVFSASGESEQAIEAYKKATVVSPSQAEPWFHLGVAYQAKGSLDNAIDAYRQAIAIEPGVAKYYDALGTVLYQMQHFDDAMVSYRKGLSLHSASPALYHHLGIALQAQGNLLDAERAFLEALALDEQNPEVHYNLALTYEHQENWATASASYAQAIELDPAYVNALIGLGRVCAEEGEYQRAVNAYQRAIKRDPRAQEAHVNLGRVLVEAKMLEKAAVCFKNALILDANDVSACEELGGIYKELDQPEEAEVYYNKAIELGSPLARHFLAAMKHEKTEAAPQQYVKELFDYYSTDFERHLLETLKYRIPDVLYKAFARVYRGNKPISKSVDLGCGTGLAGLAFKPIVTRIDGVDLSSEMLKKAQVKGIYAKLHNVGIVEYLNNCAENYDLFIAADVLTYIGNLAPLFATVKECATRGAFFVFSIERAYGEDFLLQPSGRYAHSSEYIRGLAQANNFYVLTCRPTLLRKEEQHWVRGILVILKYLGKDENY